MKYLVLATLILFACSAPVHASSEKLVGTWKSNREVTLGYLKTHTKLTPQQLDRLGSILGKMVIVFDAERITEKSGSWKFTTKYKVVEETKDTITIEAADPQTKQSTKTKFTVDATGLWAPDDKVPGYQERFDKVAKE